MRRKKDVAAVIVTYNRKKLLTQCIEKLLTQQSAECDVLVIDNGSTDGTAEALQQIHDPKIHYFNTKRNLGGAGGFHFGIKKAVEDGYRYVWIMDDDTLPYSDTLKKLQEADKLLDGQYGFLSSVVLWTDGRECKMNRQKISKSFYRHVELLKYGIIQIDQATFVSLFFRAETVLRVGLPIREFFIWGDDIEYTRRIAVRNQLPCYLVGQSRVVHAMQDNRGSNIALDSMERVPRYRYAFRNENYTYRQEGWRGICYYYAKCGLNLWRIFTQSKNHRAARCRTVLAGMLNGLFFNPSIEYPNKEPHDIKSQTII